jgi:hypothetical protein
VNTISINTALTGGNLRFAVFVSVDNGTSYSINPTMYVDFTAAQLTVGTMISGLKPATVSFQPGVVLALVPTIAQIGGTTPTGSITFDVIASLSYF